jgi:hypothetical protein
VLLIQAVFGGERWSKTRRIRPYAVIVTEIEVTKVWRGHSCLRVASDNLLRSNEFWRHPEGPRFYERAEGSRVARFLRARDPSLRLKSGYAQDDANE